MPSRRPRRRYRRGSCPRLAVLRCLSFGQPSQDQSEREAAGKRGAHECLGPLRERVALGFHGQGRLTERTRTRGSLVGNIFLGHQSTGGPSLKTRVQISVAILFATIEV